MKTQGVSSTCRHDVVPVAQEPRVEFDEYFIVRSYRQWELNYEYTINASDACRDKKPRCGVRVTYE